MFQASSFTQLVLWCENFCHPNYREIKRADQGLIATFLPVCKLGQQSIKQSQGVRNLEAHASAPLLLKYVTKEFNITMATDAKRVFLFLKTTSLWDLKEVGNIVETLQKASSAL